MNIIGHDAGIRLWNLMSSSTDPEEMRYFSRIYSVVQSSGKAWFTDIITQRQERRNQTNWLIEWDYNKSQWVISLFLVPSDVKEVSDRLLPEIDLDDIVIDD